MAVRTSSATYRFLTRHSIRPLRCEHREIRNICLYFWRLVWTTLVTFVAYLLLAFTAVGMVLVPLHLFGALDAEPYWWMGVMLGCGYWAYCVAAAFAFFNPRSASAGPRFITDTAAYRYYRAKKDEWCPNLEFVDGAADD